MEPEAQSFIVKLWLDREAAEEEARPPVLHGHITHVPSGERRYLRDLDGIKAFIAPYVERMGVRLSRGNPLCRVVRWLGAHMGRQV